MISKVEYRSLALEGIQDFEILMNHPVFPDGLQLPLLHERRYSWIVNSLMDCLSSSNFFMPGSGNLENATVMSVGCFPGSLDRILKMYFKGKINILGVGLALSNEFRNAFLGKVYDEIMTVELDPLHPANLSSSYPSTIPLDNGSADVVVAGEIFEHLYSPLHFLNEISRVLKPGGHLILTTPNISYIGNIIKLIRGRSCHEALDTSHIFMESEWRPHMRIYDRYELALLCAKSGFREKRTDFLNYGEDIFYKSLQVRLKMTILKPAFLIPKLRNGLCQIYQKEQGKGEANAHSD
jgi:SAM-dependent methyltransferase